MTVEASFTHVFARALLGEPTVVVGLGGDPLVLPVASWTRPADHADHRLLALCEDLLVQIPALSA